MRLNSLCTIQIDEIFFDETLTLIPSKPFKDIVNDEETGREYIELFAFNGGRRLPIRRVIVGPSMNQSENARKAKALVKGEVRVHLSETPFIG